MFIIGLTIVCCLFIGIQWAESIDYMKKNHPDYKGEDFLG
jgi:hypothetical protein